MSLLLDKLKKTKKLLDENKILYVRAREKENIYAREKIVYERDRQK